MDRYTYFITGVVLQVSKCRAVGFSSETAKPGFSLIIQDHAGNNYFPAFFGAVAPSVGKYYRFTISNYFLDTVVAYSAI